MWPFERRAEPENPGEEEALLRAALTNETIGRDQAMNIPTVASCINRISDTVSMIPIKLYQVKDGAAVEEIRDDPRVRLLNDDTGDTLDGVQFKRALVKDYFLGKGGYAYLNRTGNSVRSIHYVKENEISFLYNPDPIFKDYDIMIQGAKYKPFEFIKVLRNTDNGRAGRSIIEEHGKILSVVYHSLKFEENLVKTGGNKKGFIKAPRKLGQAAMDALKAAWRRLYQNNDENVVILNEGLEFQESSNTSVEMQLNENKKTNSEELCKIFSMPPAIINGGADEQDHVDYIQYCLNPVFTAIECAVNRDMLLESEKGSTFFAFDISELTKGDILKRYQAYAIAAEKGFMQPDEIRFKENLPSLGLDFIKLGLQDVLYDPKTKNIFVPNMNAAGKLNDKKLEEKGEEELED